MKYLFLLPLILMVTFANAQQKGEKKHMIFFKNYSQYDFTKITEGQKVRVILKTGDSLYGPVQQIRTDTITIRNTTVVLNDISLIDVPHFGVSAAPPMVHFLGRKEHLELHDVLTEIKYTSDTSVWKPVYPPEGAYSDPREYSNLARDIKWEIRKEDISTNHYP